MLQVWVRSQAGSPDKLNNLGLNHNTDQNAHIVRLETTTQHPNIWFY